MKRENDPATWFDAFMLLGVVGPMVALLLWGLGVCVARGVGAIL